MNNSFTNWLDLLEIYRVYYGKMLSCSSVTSFCSCIHLKKFKSFFLTSMDSIFFGLFLCLDSQNYIWVCGQKFFEHFGLKIFRTFRIEIFLNVSNPKFFEHFGPKISRTIRVELFSIISGWKSFEHIGKIFNPSSKKKSKVKKISTQNFKKIDLKCSKIFRPRKFRKSSTQNFQKKFDLNCSKNF